MIRLSDFHYDLPPEQIAQEPVTPRDQSRLMVLNRSSAAPSHHRFAELDRILRPGDVLVMNVTKVFPARLKGTKRSGGKAELLLLESLDSARWRALVRGPTRQTELVFPEGLTAEMETRLDNGEWVIHFSRNHLREYLDVHGEMPLPPYIKRPVSSGPDRQNYQTVYARAEGAVAAPTAGFHFTEELLERLRAKGVEILELTLHVGWGTFRPVRHENVVEHPMLPETYEVTSAMADAYNRARLEHRRIIAVGTTATRALETLTTDRGVLSPGKGATNLFIFPGYRFKSIDALMTNFHLPDSTPLLLANAFYGADADHPFLLRPAYQEAIEKKYRFYSYGDAMLIE